MIMIIIVMMLNGDNKKFANGVCQSITNWDDSVCVSA